MSAFDETRCLLDEFEHECFMIRVEASETRAKDDVVRKAYEQQREKTAQAIAATLGDGAKPCPWCGREMQEGHHDGHVWYRDDSDYIASLKRSIDALQKALATLGGGECEKESNYKRLFGTPERAARTLAMNCYGATSDACEMCVNDDCDGSLRNKPVLSAIYDALLEWLRSDA